MNQPKKIGILGGTFNPPHCGHTYIAKSACEMLGLSEIIFIPSKIPPHKQLPEQTPPPSNRLEMLKLAVSELDFAVVSEIELNRPGKSYTVDTLRELSEQMPDAKLYFIMGADMLLTFEQWKDFAEILKFASLAVSARIDRQYDRLCQTADSLRQKFGADIEILHTDALAICSTSLRKDLSIGIINKNLNSSVADYIRKNKLYNWNEPLYNMRECVRRSVSDKRLLHTSGCERMAAALALRWNVDEYQARTAAVLHDITRELPYEKQLKLCEDYGIITEDMRKMPGMTLHALTGAEFCRHEFGVPASIVNAIRWHTTARADMTLLEKIIYIADGIEQTRSYSHVRELRRLAFSDLDAAVRESLGSSIRYIREKGGTVLSDTLDAYQFLCARTG